jgi:hypothetical protein
MQKRNRIFTFGQRPYPAVVDEFIAKPRPVKVWYNTSTYDAYGLPPGDGDPGSVFSFLVIQKADSSRLISNVKYSFSRVFVIADQARLRGVSRGQFAAYAAMVGLAELKPNARVGDAPTILKLFEGAPQAAPADLSDWDRAFLKALYATEQRSNLQESAISRSMVREIAH